MYHRARRGSIPPAAGPAPARSDGTLDGLTEPGQDDGAADCLDHLRNGQGARVVVHDRALPLQTYLRSGRPPEPLQGSPDPTGSERTDHPSNRQLRTAVAGRLVQALRPEQSGHWGHANVAQVQPHAYSRVMAGASAMGPLYSVSVPGSKGFDTTR